MINLPKLDSIELSGKKVLVRADLDLGEKIEPGDEIKLATLLPTINFLLENNSRIILIGHRGRPDKNPDVDLSLKEVCLKLSELLGKEIHFISKIYDDEVRGEVDKMSDGNLIMLENLRFNPGEEENSGEFAKNLAGLAEVYINEAFSTSHREHASIVGIPKLLPHAAGLHFFEEVEKLSQVFDNQKKPVVVLLSGVKEDKLKYIDQFSKFADKILVSGRLPDYMGDDKIGVRLYKPEDKVIAADLIQDKEDITIHSIEVFEEIIKGAGTIVVSGPMGKYEDKGHRQGSERVLKAVAETDALKIAGGGDTEQAIALLGFKDKFDWISVGGGAMLEFLARGTLRGIEVLNT